MLVICSKNTTWIRNPRLGLDLFARSQLRQRRRTCKVAVGSIGPPIHEGGYCNWREAPGKDFIEAYDFYTKFHVQMTSGSQSSLQ